MTPGAGGSTAYLPDQPRGAGRARGPGRRRAAAPGELGGGGNALPRMPGAARRLPPAARRDAQSCRPRSGSSEKEQPAAPLQAREEPHSDRRMGKKPVWPGGAAPSRGEGGRKDRAASPAGSHSDAGRRDWLPRLPL